MNCFPLWFACLANCVSLTQGQVDCDGGDVEQCEVGYYCDSDYRCKQCAPCEHFRPSNPCAKSLRDCGVCLEGHQFLSIGKCGLQTYDRNVGTILWLVATGCSAFILLILVFYATFNYIRKKRTKTYTCSNRYGPESGAVSNEAIAPSAPEYPPAPPPYTSQSSQPAHNSLYTKSSEPLLKSMMGEPECQLEQHQMAHPYSQYVRLPPGSHSLNGELENLNENMGVARDIDNEDVINNNELPSSPRPSVHHPVSGVLMPMLPADPVTDSLPLQDMIISTQVQESNIVSCMETTAAGLDGADSESGRSRASSPDHAAAGAQQVIVQFISHVSPILNLQGNNTRK